MMEIKGIPSIGNPERLPASISLPAELKMLPIEIINPRDGSRQIYKQRCLESSGGQVYEIGRILKEALFGYVYHACLLQKLDTGPTRRRSNSNNEEFETVYVRSSPLIEYAIKTYSRQAIASSGNQAENPVNELAAIQYIGSLSYVIAQHECCHDRSFLYSIMEFMEGGELFEEILMNGKKDEAQARIIFSQILEGVYNIHSKGIVHRDLSLENVLVSRRHGLVKIIDLGMCLKVPFDSNTNSYMLIPKQGSCGKMNYMAPEVFSNEGPFDPFLCDIWALGIILFILLAGVPLLESPSPLDLRYIEVVSGRLGLLIAKWGIQVSPDAVDLIQNILKANPIERLTIEQIKAHRWFST